MTGNFQTPVSAAEKTLMLLVQSQRLPYVGVVFRMLCKWKGVTIPPETFSRRPHIAHVGPIVVHRQTRIAPSVTLFHGVTIGRSDIWSEADPSFDGFEIRERAIICAGASIVSGAGKLVVGEGAVIGANAVLTQSTGPWEVWAGVPARRIGFRQRQ